MMRREDEVERLGARFDRIVTSVALATTGDFEQATAVLDEVIQDEFGIVEEALRLFLSELHAAELRNTTTMQALARSNQELEQKLEMIERQRLVIDELSAPLIDVWADVIAVPLVGALDSERTAHITDALLHRVTAARARWVLIDLTGVRVVDDRTADHLTRLVGAVELIGARCILTGISPYVADSLLSHDHTLGPVRTMRTLREALQHCMAHARRRPA